MALFAALSFAVTSTTRTSEADTENELSSIDAGRILQTCSDLRQHTTRFLFNGRSDTQIEMNDGADPTIPCRSGANCLFGSEGGGAIIPIPPQRKGNKGAISPEQMVYEFYETSDGEYLPGYSSNKPLVMFMAKNLSYEFCKKMNRALGIVEEPPAVTTLDAMYRDGCLVSFDHFVFKCPLTR